MKLIFSEVKLVFDTPELCKNGIDIIVNLTGLIIGHNYRINLIRRSFLSGLFEIRHESNLLSQNGESTRYFSFVADNETKTITFNAILENMPSFVLEGQIIDLDSLFDPDAEDFLTIVCDPTQLIPPTPTNTSSSTPTPTPTFTSTPTVTGTSGGRIVNNIDFFDMDKIINIDEKLYTDTLGVSYWALSDIKELLFQPDPSMSDVFIRKPGENVLFKLEDYTPNTPTDGDTFFVSVTDQVISYAGDTIVGAGSLDNKISTGSDNILANKNISFTANVDGNLKFFPMISYVGNPVDGIRLNIKKNNNVINSVVYNSNLSTNFTNIEQIVSAINISVVKGDIISFAFNIDSDNLYLRYKLFYDRNVKAYLINNKINPTISLFKNHKYTFSINASGFDFWIQNIPGDLNLDNIYKPLGIGNGQESGTFEITIPKTSTLTALYYTSDIPLLGMNGLINIKNSDFVRISDFVLCPSPTPTPSNTPSLTPSNSGTPPITPSHTATATNTQTPTQTQTQTATCTNTQTNTSSATPTYTASTTPTPTYTMTNTPTSTDLLGKIEYFISNDIDVLSDLPPTSDNIVPYHETKTIKVDRYTNNNEILNNEFVFSCIDGGSFILQLKNLTIGDKYRFSIEIPHPNDALNFSLEPNNEEFVAVDITQNINIICFYTGSSPKILVKLRIENVSKKFSEDEFFIFRCE